MDTHRQGHTCTHTEHDKLTPFCMLWSPRSEFAASLSSPPPLRRTRESSLCPITFLQPSFSALSALLSKTSCQHEHSGSVPPSAGNNPCGANCKVSARTVISRAAVIATFFGILAVGILTRYFVPQPSPRNGWVHTNETVPFYNGSLPMDTFRQPYLNLNGLY